MHRRLFIPLAAAGLLVGCAKSGPEPLVVGMELAYPPFEMSGPDNAPAGLGRPLRIENTTFDGLIPALKTGRIHLVISSMTDTAERRNSIDFSEPYLRTGLAILAAADRGVNGVGDLNRAGRTVVVKLGTTGELYARDHLKDARVNVLREESACALEVTQGKADAFLYDQMSVLGHWQRHPDTTRALLTPFQQESWAVGLRKGDNALRAQVNAFLTSFRAAGGFDRLAEKHLSERKSAFTQLGVPFVF
jgi:polar amino acid transport system substrate-binding protein